MRVPVMAFAPVTALLMAFAVFVGAMLAPHRVTERSIAPTCADLARALRTANAANGNPPLALAQCNVVRENGDAFHWKAQFTVGFGKTDERHFYNVYFAYNPYTVTNVVQYGSLVLPSS